MWFSHALAPKYIAVAAANRSRLVPIRCHGKGCKQQLGLALPPVGWLHFLFYLMSGRKKNGPSKVPAHLRMICYFSPPLAQQLPVTPLLFAAIRLPPSLPASLPLPPPQPWGVCLCLSVSLCTVKWRRHGELVRQ